MANTSIEITSLDFSGIKSNLIKWLQSKDTFKDYNFTGSGLSMHTDILAVNTQYNGFYLNMVANEMFLDSAIHRNSVVSHVKPLAYVPRSKIAPSATVNITVKNVTSDYLILPQNTNLMSESIDGVNYNFVTTESYTKEATDGEVVFENVVIKQGYYNTYTFDVDKQSNPNLIFTIPDENIDTSTLTVIVQKTSSSSDSTVYTLAKDYLEITGEDTIYFLQEGINNYYEIYFGDGILGKTLETGNVVTVTYISTSATSAYGASSFVILDAVQGFADIIVDTVAPATNGAEKETIDSIKFCAPRMYGTKKRAVVPEEYKIILNNNTLGYSFDDINAWSGENNMVYIAVKPTGDYYLTNTQKEQIVDKILKPCCVMTITPKIVDPEYLFVKLKNRILCDANSLTIGEESIKTLVLIAEQTFCSKTLNTFASSFNVGKLTRTLESLDKSIIAVDFDTWIEKRIYPNLNTMTSYEINFDNEILAGADGSSVEITPSISYYNTDGVLFENVNIVEEDGILKLKYVNESGTLTTLNSNIGTVDFKNGVVNLNNFSPVEVNNADRVIKVSVMTKSRILESINERILSLDVSDNTAIQTEVSIKK